MKDAEYQAEYDKAAAELEAAAQATTARGADGKFVKAEPTPEPTPQPTPEPVKKEEAKVEPKGEVKEPVNDDPLADLKAELEKVKKVAKDNQAWATRLAQERANEKREREAQERAAAKPAILDANPELADAIRYVAHDPKPAQDHQDAQKRFYDVVDKAHPGIFSNDIEPELLTAVMKRIESLDDQSRQDPLVVIREITEEKLAYATLQVGKRFAAEAAKQAQKSAMSVPGAGGGSGVMAPVDSQLAEVQRIQKMSDKDFAAEVRRVKGL